MLPVVKRGCIQEYCYQMVSVCFNSDCLKEIHHDMDMLGRLVGGANQEDRLTNTMRIAKFNAELNTPVCDKEKRKSVSSTRILGIRGKRLNLQVTF